MGNLDKYELNKIRTSNIFAEYDKMIFKKKSTIENVIFNDPATIVFWADGSKTVVKCGEGDTFDPEKGLAMAISKKYLGNKGNYFNTIKKWTEPYYEKEEAIEKTILDTLNIFMSFTKDQLKKEEKDEKDE